MKSYVNAKPPRCMFLHFVPVDGVVEYFSGFFGRVRYVFRFPEKKPVNTALPGSGSSYRQNLNIP